MVCEPGDPEMVREPGDPEMVREAGDPERVFEPPWVNLSTAKIPWHEVAPHTAALNDLVPVLIHDVRLLARLIPCLLIPIKILRVLTKIMQILNAILQIP